MEVFYEESATNNNAEKEMKRAQVLKVFALIFMIIGLFGVMMGISYIPINSIATWFIICGTFFLFSFLFLWLRRRYNVSYDYVFVSGELRISKVFNTNKRKLRAIIECSEIVQIGDMDNGAVERFSASPDVLTVICTPNDTPMDDKFFMYIYTDDKTLYLLECRELLLMNILKFARRSVLEREYVMQDKKQKKV